MTTPMTRDDIVELMARGTCTSGGLDPDFVMANDGPRWRYYVPLVEESLSALEAAGCQIVQGEPTYWHYGRGPLEGKIRLFSDPHLVDTGWTETPLYAGKVQP